MSAIDHDPELQRVGDEEELGAALESAELHLNRAVALAKKLNAADADDIFALAVSLTALINRSLGLPDEEEQS